MRLPKPLGTIVFWLAWPVLWLYLKGSQRTRVIIVCEGKILLIKAWLGTDDWGLPGGGRHKHESVEAAGIREVLEETGIDISVCEKRFLFTDKPIKEFGFSFSQSCIAVEIAAEPELSLQRSEIVEAIWADKNTLAELGLSEASKQCLEAWSDSLDLIH